MSLRFRALCSMWLIAAAISGGCAGTPAAFAAKYPDNVHSDVDKLIERLRAAPPHSESSIGVGVTAAPHKLYGYDLASRRVLWELPTEPKFSPLLAGDAVVTQEGDDIIGRSLKSGSKLFSIDADDMSLVGAAGDDTMVVVTLTSGMGTFARSRVVLISGSVTRWQRKLDFPAGAPAIVGSVVLVPWSNQYLSALTLDDGDEFARVRVRDDVIGHAFVAQGQVFAGSQHGVAQLTSELASGQLKAGPYRAAPREDLPGRPAFLRDVYTPSAMPVPDGAPNRIRMTWLPKGTDSKTIELAGDNLYLVFYRFVFALDPNDLGLHWVFANDADLVGARAQSDGLAVADVNGQVRYLAAHSGKTLWFEKNAPVSVDLELPSDGAAVGVAPDETAPDPAQVRLQLMAAAQDPDSRLVPMRLLAIELLAKLDDAEATANLLGLCDDERTTSAVRKAACSALKDRKTGGDYLLTALERHAAYLEGTLPPPVGALAKAAATQKEKRAVPLLVAHLGDPSTTPQTLSAIVTALADLGDVGAAEPLAAFLRLYHADPIDEYVVKALELIPAALVKLQGPAAREALEPIVKDPLSAGTVREHARLALAGLDDQAKAAEKDEDAEKLAETQAAEKAEAAATKTPDKPEHITNEIVKRVLAPVRAKLSECVQAAKPEQFQARVVLVIEDGQVLMVSVVPAQLQSCVEPLIRSQKFPSTLISKRERLSYQIRRY